MVNSLLPKNAIEKHNQPADKKVRATLNEVERKLHFYDIDNIRRYFQNNYVPKCLEWWIYFNNWLSSFNIAAKINYVGRQTNLLDFLFSILSLSV